MQAYLHTALYYYGHHHNHHHHRRRRRRYRLLLLPFKQHRYSTNFHTIVSWVTQPSTCYTSYYHSHSSLAVLIHLAHMSIPHRFLSVDYVIPNGSLMLSLHISPQLAVTTIFLKVPISAPAGISVCKIESRRQR